MTLASYSSNGNVTSKLDVANNASGTYGYDPNKPHAVNSAWDYTMGYDANGNVTSRSKTGESWNFRYAGFDKPRWMAKTVGGVTAGSEFLYGANRSRVVRLEFDAMSTAPTHYTRKRVYALGSTLELNYVNKATAGSTSVWSLDTVKVYVAGPDGIVGAREFTPLAAVDKQ